MKSKLLLIIAILLFIICLSAGGYVFSLFNSENIVTDSQAANTTEDILLIRLSSADNSLLSYPDEVESFINGKVDAVTNVYEEIKDGEGTFYMEFKSKLANPGEGSFNERLYFGTNNMNYVVKISNTEIEGYLSEHLFVWKEFINGVQGDYIMRSQSYIKSSSTEYYENVLNDVDFATNQIKYEFEIASDDLTRMDKVEVKDGFYIINYNNSKMYISLNTTYMTVMIDESQREVREAIEVSIGNSEADKVKIPE